MFEGVVGSLVAKIVASVATALGIFGGLAVTGVIPIIGNNAADSVAVETLAGVDTEDDSVELGTYLEVPGVQRIASEVPLVDELTQVLPNVEGVISNGGRYEESLPALGLVGTILNTATGTVNSVLRSLPVVNDVVPSVSHLPVGAIVETPVTRSPIAGMDLVEDTLYSVPATVRSLPTRPILNQANATVDGLPLAGELLRTARQALQSLLPELLVIVE